MDPEQRRLFLEIIECPIFLKHHTSSKGPRSGCERVLSFQPRGLSNAQVPEPWNGNLSARIMFLSSNPSIHLREQYPRGRPTRPDAIRFFQNRFFGVDPDLRKRWIDDQMFVLLQDGERAERAPQYWAEIRNTIDDLFAETLEPKELDSRVCMSEVVHCKSKENIGVMEAAPTCTSRYLRQLLSLSKARVIIVYGEARPYVWQLVEDRRHFDANDDACRLLNPPIGVFFGQLRMFLFLPQPGSSGTRRLSRVLNGEQFAIARTMAIADDEVVQRLAARFRPR